MTYDSHNSSQPSDPNRSPLKLGDDTPDAAHRPAWGAAGTQRRPARHRKKRIHATWPDTLLWLSLLLLVLVHFVLQIANRQELEAQTPLEPTAAADMSITLSARVAVASRQLEGLVGKVAGDEGDALEDLYKKNDLTVVDRVRLAALTGELHGADAALEALAETREAVDAAVEQQEALLRKREARLAERFDEHGLTLPPLLETGDADEAAYWDKLSAAEAARVPERLRSQRAQLRSEATAAAEDIEAVRADIAVLETIYDRPNRDETAGVDVVSEAAQERLVERHAWFGELALAHGQSDKAELRSGVLWAAMRTLIIMGTLTLVLLLLGLVGFALGIGAFVLYLTGKLNSGYRESLMQAADPADTPDERLAEPRTVSPTEGDPRPGARRFAPGEYPAPADATPLEDTFDPNSGEPEPQPAVAQQPDPEAPSRLPTPPPGWTAGAPTSADPVVAHYPRAERRPFFEAFIAYMFGMLVLGFISSLALYLLDLRSPWFMLLGLSPLLLLLLYPLLRNVQWQHLLAGMGFTRGKGVVLEMLAGLAGYLAGVPILLIGALLAFAVSFFVDQEATHPIAEELADPSFGQVIAIYVLACIWAPVTEEVMFRGALYHYLRAWAAPLISGLIVALVFAAIHPQGIAGVPMLTAIAVVMALIREWRGSIIAPVTAHALNNFMAVTISLLVML